MRCRGKGYIVQETKYLSVLRLSPIQYSCTTLQFVFDRSMLRYYWKLVRRLQLDADKVRPYTEVDGQDVWFSYHDIELELGGEKEEKLSNEELVRLMFVARDAGAKTSIAHVRVPLGGPWYFASAPPCEWLFVHATSRCSLGCEWCYLDRSGSDDVPLGTLRKFLRRKRRELKEYNRPLPETFRRKLGITIGGGEPTEHPRYAELASLCRKYADVLTVSTNGTDMDATLAPVRFDGVAVSAPFMYDKELTDAYARVSLRQVKRAVAEAKGRVGEVCLSVIVTSAMRPDDVERVVRRAKSWGADKVLFMLFKPWGGGERYRNLFPPLSLAREVLCRLSELKDVLVDSCLLRYTLGFPCLYDHELVTRDSLERGRRHRVCPWWERRLPCIVDRMYSSERSASLR